MYGYSDLTTAATSDVAAVIRDSGADGGGCLRLRASRTGSGYKTSKSVTTGRSMTFKYGYLEMRARVPVGRGVWPSLWMKSNVTPEGAEIAEKLGCRSAADYFTEIDIFEVFGNNSVSTQLHKWWEKEEDIKKYGVRSSSVNNGSFDISDGGWHIYGMLWTPHEISMFVDGTRYITYNLSENIGGSGGMQGFHDPHCLILNNHIFTPGYTSTSGGEWAKNVTVGSDFTKADYDIDYIRLYQKNDGSKIYFAN